MFDVGLVVFLIRARASKADFFLFAIVDEIPIEEFRAVIGINIEEIKGQSMADGFKSLADAQMAFTINSPALDPLRVNVHGIESVDKFSGS